MKLRGPGDYLGTRQSGLPNFKVAQISDFEILHQAREAASKLLICDPKLQHKDNFDLSKLVIGYEERLYSDIN